MKSSHPQIDARQAVPVMVEPKPEAFAQAEVEKQYTPIGDQIAAWIEPSPTTTEGGLIIGEKAMESFRTPIAKVIAIGPKVEQVKVGDRILVAHGTNIMRIKVDGKESIVMFENRVLGVLD